jgi:hypothetical protein
MLDVRFWMLVGMQMKLSEHLLNGMYFDQG